MQWRLAQILLRYSTTIDCYKIGSILHPQAVLQFRTSLRNGYQIFQGLVQWNHLSLKDNTWDDID